MSVLLGAHNHAAYVEQALESIAGQTFRDFELIVTDDCSTDGSRRVIQSWLARTHLPATFIANDRNLGICAVLNRALRRARGRFVCVLSADDWCEPDRLERQHAFFLTLPEDVGFIYSDVRVCDAAGRAHRSYLAGKGTPDGRIFDVLLHGIFVPAPGVMIRRAALDAVGPYDEALLFEDSDMWLRIASTFQVRHLPGIVANWRVLESSLSHAPQHTGRRQETRIRVLLKWLGRSADTDRFIAARVRYEAMGLATQDRRAARQAIRPVAHVAPALRWRLAAVTLALPGGQRVLATALRAKQMVRDRRTGT